MEWIKPIDVKSDTEILFFTGAELGRGSLEEC
jgi:hypothetical protein